MDENQDETGSAGPEDDRVRVPTPFSLRDRVHPQAGIALVFLVIVVLVALVSPSRRDLFVGDETKYSRIVQQMIQNDDYLVLAKDGELYSHKPPLHFWTIAFFVKAFGLESTWSFVMPSLIAFALVVVLVGKFQHLLFGRDGLVASLVFATFWLAWGSGQSARMDMTFALLIGIAAMLYWIHRDTSAWAPAVGAGFACGVAVLVKGPMALAVLGSLVLIEGIRTRCLPSGKVLAAGGIAAAIPLAWVGVAVRVGGIEFGRELLIRQTIGRAFSSWVHGEPVWFYLARFPLTFFPWFLVLLVGLYVAFRRETVDADRDAARFVSSWFLAAFLPFSLMSSKLDVYMLPAMIPGAMLVAFVLGQQGLSGRLSAWISKGFRAVLLLLAVIPCLAMIGLWATREDLNPDLALARDPSVIVVLLISTMVVASALWIIPKQEGIRDSAIVFGMVALFPAAALLNLAAPVINEAATTRPLVDAISRYDVPAEEIALYWTPHLWVRGMPAELHEVVYLGKPVIDGSPVLVVVRRDKAIDLGEPLMKYRVVESVRLIGKVFDVYKKE